MDLQTYMFYPDLRIDEPCGWEGMRHYVATGLAIHGGIKTYIEEFQPQILDREEHMREQDGPASIRIDYCNWIEIFIDFLIWRPEGKWIIEWNREEGECL
ncbi:unnamed protein product [Durusdinium trenchii]|uniref:Uncharacterized protein n=1 Tax=Durusdinium trenchii TaxID=1381693 RepID=A0ABP0JH06_9DINO